MENNRDRCCFRTDPRPGNLWPSGLLVSVSGSAFLAIYDNLREIKKWAEEKVEKITNGRQSQPLASAKR